MSKRIRYKFEAHIGTSKQFYKIGDGQEVKVVIDKLNFKFEIVDAENNLIAHGGDTKNYIVLLRQAKTALERLGCTFTTEERDRDYGLVSKRNANEVGTV